MQFPLSSRVLFFLYKSECVVLKIEVPPLSGPRRYFSHHSVKDNSLQEYSSFAGETIGTHIEKYRSLVMSLRFVRQAVANNTAQSLVLFVKFGAHMLAALRLVFRL